MQARTLWVRFAVTWHGPTTEAFHVGHSSTAVRGGGGDALWGLLGIIGRRLHLPGPVCSPVWYPARQGLYGSVCL